MEVVFLAPRSIRNPDEIEGEIMIKGSETLAEYVRRTRLERGLSCMDVQQRSARAGKKIVASYVNRIENGIAGRVSNDRLLALAHGLGVPEEELLDVARGVKPKSKGDAEEVRLVARFRELSPERRSDILKMIDVWHSEEVSRRTPRRRSA